jgi:hypothetical protein
VQPTDLGLVGFRVSPEKREDREEDERVSGSKRQGLVIGMASIKYRVFRLMVTLTAIAGVALAGGASVKGW